MNWPLRVRFWKWLHGRFNRLAWRYGLEPGWAAGDIGSGLHMRRDHWTWRLNGWASRHWIEWWMRETLADGRTRSRTWEDAQHADD